MADKCSNCFYSKLVPGAQNLSCHKHAPSPALVKRGGTDILVWPGVTDDEWCGDFREKIVTIPMPVSDLRP